tara:strand:+ start:21543 stop:21884 length:342 start_codon:yes stop_codon:yes gene_type:complete
MIRGITIYDLSPDQLFSFLKVLEPQVYQIDQTLIYKGNVPNAAFCLLSGKLQIRKYDNSTYPLFPNQIIGLDECLKHSPFKHTLEVHKGTKLLVLPLSFLKNNQLIHSLGQTA